MAEHRTVNAAVEGSSPSVPAISLKERDTMKVEARLATTEDAPKFVEWTQTTADNMFDRDISGYPSLRTLAIDKDGRTDLYVPFHPVLMVESLAHRPGIERKDNARALRKFQDTAEELAKGYGMAEIYWLCKDETLINFSERHGYEVFCRDIDPKTGKLTKAMLRKKVSF